MRAKPREGWVGLGTEHSPSSQGLPLSSLGRLDSPFWSSVSPNRMYCGTVHSVTQIATLSQEGRCSLFWISVSCLGPGLVGPATVTDIHTTRKSVSHLWHGVAA